MNGCRPEAMRYGLDVVGVDRPFMPGTRVQDAPYSFRSVRMA